MFARLIENLRLRREIEELKDCIQHQNEELEELRRMIRQAQHQNHSRILFDLET